MACRPLVSTPPSNGVHAVHKRCYAALKKNNAAL